MDNVKMFGNENLFQLLNCLDGKEHTEIVSAMEIGGAGCVVRTSTWYNTGESVSMSESSTFVPGVKVVEIKNGEDKVIGRELKSANWV